MGEPQRTIIDIFFDQINKNPDKIAIDEDGASFITYADLWRCSTKIAGAIIPTEKDDGQLTRRVAICLDRSANLIYAAWGVLMSAQAYLFLDPDDATNRNVKMLEAFGVDMVVTSRNHAGMFQRSELKKLEVHVVEELLAGPDNNELKLPYIGPASTAYVLQTSGSSGMPKGVVISHQAALPGVVDFTLDGSMRWLFLFNPIHSASQRLIIGIFCKGGTLCIVPKERLTQLPDVIEMNRIEALGITPSLLKVLNPTQLPKCLTQVVSISEPLPQDLANKFAERVELYVAYGLSEVAQLNIKRRFKPGDKSNLLAWPSDSTRVKILVPGTEQEVSPGESGELCFIGPQLANGYLDNPVATEKAFHENPFGNGMMLRTGDEACATEGGFNITGRLDDMIKINGQKLEPAEIQAVLDKHPHVIQSRIVGVEYEGVKHPVAAIQLHPDVDWAETKLDLLSLARQNLPAYMIPDYWMRLEMMPQTAAGKFDKQRLIREIKSTPTKDLRLRPPSCDETPLDDNEQVIRKVFADVLQMPENDIGRDASFPDLGGDSMQAFEVINRLREKGVHVTIEAIVTKRESIYSLRKDVITARQQRQLTANLMSSADENDPFPLSEIQTSLIMMTMHLGSLNYTYQRLWDMRSIDVERLKHCLQQLPSLKTTVIEINDQLFQTRAGEVFFRHVKGSLCEFLGEDRAAGFKYGEPFARFALVEDGDDYVLVETRHHALFDFISSRFMCEDAARLYQREQPIARPPYRRFVEAMAQKDWTATGDFWKSHLTGTEPCQLNSILVPGARNAKRTLGSSIYELSKRLSVTEASVVATAWAIVLSKQTGSNSVLFGTTFSGRDENVPYIEDIDGPTLAVALVKYELGGKLRDILRYGQAVLSETQKHSQYGLIRILKAANSNPDIFDTMVNFVHHRETGNAVFERFGEEPQWRTEQTTLMIERIRVDALRPVSYKVRLTGEMEQRRLEFVVDQFIKVIELMMNEPNRDLRYVNVLGKEELELLSEHKQLTGQPRATLLSDFDAMVARYPTKIALQFETAQYMSYQSLDKKANQFAHFLTDEYDVRQGDFICLTFDHSIEAIVTMLAVLKAGAAFVPLSPKSPTERKRGVIADTGAQLLLTTKHLLHVCRQEDLGINVVAVDSIDYDACPAVTPDRVWLGADDTAYVLCTSGSTGRPKAVPTSHGSIAAFLTTMREFERLTPKDKYLHFSDYVFDGVIHEIFTTLSTGATLCIPSEENRLTNLARVMNDMDVTHAFLVPIVAHDLAKQEPEPRSLRQMVIGGDALDQKLLRTWTIEKKRKIIQCYGPTETTVMTNLRYMQGGDLPNNLGCPVPTVQQFILQPDGGTELVPYGAVGELCTAGLQLSKGYLARERETRDAFKRVNIGGIETQIYRTGDLARFLPGSEILYLGRKDCQIKINGKRVELGEAEEVFRSSKLVEDCAAVAARIQDRYQIVMYVVFDKTNALDDHRLKQELWSEVEAGPLMEYMRPKILKPVNSIPKLLSDKVDRKRITQEVQSMSACELSGLLFPPTDTNGLQEAALTTDNEKLLATLWAEILRIQGDYAFHKASHFLRLGGDSMAAVALSRRALMGYDFDLPTRAILKHPVLSEMVLEMRQRTRKTQSVSSFMKTPRAIQEEMSKVGLEKSAWECLYPCLPGQSEFLSQCSKSDRTWVLQTTRNIANNVSMLELQREIETLTEMNDILRTTFIKNNGRWYGVVLREYEVKFEYRQVLSQAHRDEEIATIYRRPFEFGHPFIRYVVVEQPNDCRELVITMNHGLYDGTMLKIFSSHLKAVRSKGPMPSLSLFKHLVFHHYAGLKNERQSALDYFAERKPFKTRIFDIEDPDASETIFVDKAVDGLEEFARRAEVTIPVVIQAAFSIVLSGLTGTSETSLDSLVDGRHINVPCQPGHDPAAVNGPCVNFAPMTFKVSGSIRDFLKHVNSVFREVAENAIVSLDDIYAVWGLDRGTHQNQVMCLYQPYHLAELWMFQSLDKNSIHVEVAEQEYGRWGTTAGLETKMRKPYAMVVEGCELPRKEEKRIKISFDPRVMEQAKCVPDEMWDAIEKMVHVDMDENVINVL
ncbi:hypothetical protein TruAng_005436 [Truncatella angustata]|nr:hypothetical protein TruAng_005436 [Truncatella angustata]